MQALKDNLLSACLPRLLQNLSEKNPDYFQAKVSQQRLDRSEKVSDRNEPCDTSLWGFQTIKSKYEPASPTIDPVKQPD